MGTGPGDAGSQAIYETLSAQRDQATWGVDVAVVHQRMAGQMVQEGLLANYVDDISTGALANSESARNALGVDVEGHVMPMFQSQIAIAYNPDLLEQPPESYAALANWVEEHPGEFGYNGITGGMAGSALCSAGCTPLPTWPTRCKTALGRRMRQHAGSQR